MKKFVIFIVTLLIFSAIFIAVTYLESLKGATGLTAIEPNSKYSNNADEKLLKTVAIRPTLSPKDLIAKEQLVSTLKNKDGIVLSTKSYVLEYIKSADSFMAEIKTTNVDLSKGEVINYFRSKNMTDEGICSLPLVFYLNLEIAKDYSLKNETFNPIPDFCN